MSSKSAQDLSLPMHDEGVTHRLASRHEPIANDRSSMTAEGMLRRRKHSLSDPKPRSRLRRSTHPSPEPTSWDLEARPPSLCHRCPVIAIGACALSVVACTIGHRVPTSAQAALDQRAAAAGHARPRCRRAPSVAQRVARPSFTGQGSSGGSPGRWRRQRSAHDISSNPVKPARRTRSGAHSGPCT